MARFGYGLPFFGQCLGKITCLLDIRMFSLNAGYFLVLDLQQSNKALLNFFTDSQSKLPFVSKYSVLFFCIPWYLVAHPTCILTYTDGLCFICESP